MNKNGDAFLDCFRVCCTSCYRKGIYVDWFKALHGSMGVKTRGEYFQ